MTKRGSIKRISTIPQSASNSIDIKARKRIEQLFEITDEIINAYNEINEKYVNQIYRKYKQLQEVNKNLKEKLHHYHCAGCQCTIKSNGNEEDESSEEEENDDDDQQTKTPAIPSSSTNSIITRSKKNNPFIISDIEETQNFDGNDSRFNKNSSDDEAMDSDRNTHKRKRTNESSEESEEEEEEDDDEEVDEDNGMARLPLALQNVIQNKARRNKNAKAYLLEIPRYPALCEYLRDKSRTSFDHRPSEIQVRPLIENHISKNLANEAKIRMRLRDELREIHRSYLRTFMTDPHATGQKSTIQKPKLLIKKSPT